MCICICACVCVSESCFSVYIHRPVQCEPFLFLLPKALNEHYACHPFNQYREQPGRIIELIETIGELSYVYLNRTLIVFYIYSLSLVVCLACTQASILYVSFNDYIVFQAFDSTDNDDTYTCAFTIQLKINSDYKLFCIQTAVWILFYIIKKVSSESNVLINMILMQQLISGSLKRCILLVRMLEV